MNKWTNCPQCGEEDMPVKNVNGVEVVVCSNLMCNSDSIPPLTMHLKAMASAPKDCGKVLVLEEYTDAGMVERSWNLVYWLEPFDGNPGGWYGKNCGDLRNPIGWILSTNQLPTM